MVTDRDGRTEFRARQDELLARIKTGEAARRRDEWIVCAVAIAGGFIAAGLFIEAIVRG